VTTDRGSDGRALPGVAHELAVGSGLTVDAGLETTEVHPRFEGVVVLEGLDEGGLNGRGVCADDARRSASLPRLGDTDVTPVAERSGEGMRVSMRRISCTLLIV
jgi:hypothetical protein